MRASDISVGGRFRLASTDAVYTRVMPDFLLPSKAEWNHGRGLGVPSSGHIFAVDSRHRLVAIHPDNSVLAARDSDLHPGYEPIEIDGCACEIGWCDGNDDAFWCVIRHGCQIGKGNDRERAITDARASLNEPGTWLRGPKPDHSGKPA